MQRFFFFWSSFLGFDTARLSSCRDAYSLFPPTVGELSLSLIQAALAFGRSDGAELGAATAARSWRLWRCSRANGVSALAHRTGNRGSFAVVSSGALTALFVGSCSTRLNRRTGSFFCSVRRSASALGRLRFAVSTSRTAVVLVYFWPIRSLARILSYVRGALLARARVGERKDRAPLRPSRQLIALAVSVGAPLFWAFRVVRRAILAGLVEETTVSIAPPTRRG